MVLAKSKKELGVEDGARRKVASSREIGGAKSEQR